MFGLNLSQSATGDPVGDARHAEELGFDFVSTSDHPCGTHPSSETWTLLTWVAAHTTRIRIATRVLGVPYRPPAMVAKMAETLDRLSGGRLVLGLGGGYSDEEFRAFGLGVPTPRQKVDGMVEAIEIMRGLWSEPGFSYEGTRYRVERADLEPKPERRIPLWLGTYGPRALEATGRLADGWIPSLGFAPPERAAAMRDRVRAAAERAGRDPDGIACVYNVPVRIGDPVTGASATGDPGVLEGSADQVVERLLGLRRLGFTSFNLMPSGPDPRDQAERLAHGVLPALRG
ncbi:LLM class flavin-dependent oxidoreductase [Actinomadura kijaniata]|uniref:LLM class flavin-dependent oxidoreductase n=1 Tax=Actinomadura kijaniata TaxID=46161 RepID=UPI0008301D8D|nr:LLM class flavin-dependent oxidoreductase [Actinomadura kijaniata]